MQFLGDYQLNNNVYLYVEFSSKTLLWWNFDYTMEQSEEGYKNFTVIKCKIKSIEWLYLAAKGHRRAKFNLETNKNAWLVP